jgi:hypothetical protein
LKETWFEYFAKFIWRKDLSFFELLKLPPFSCPWKHGTYIMLTLGVMAHRCSILGPQNKSWVQTQWNVGETFVSILPMSLTWGCQWLVKLGLLLCFPPKKKKSIGSWATTINFWVLAIFFTYMHIGWLDMHKFHVHGHKLSQNCHHAHACTFWNLM